MAEKKRVRPTLTQVRALENELKATKANYENLSGILDEKNAEIKDLRSKYEALEKKYNKLKEKGETNTVPTSDYNALQEKYNKLKAEKENQKKLYDGVCAAHDDTVKKNRELSDRISELTADNDDYAAEIIRLKSRGLLSRIFNL